MGVMRIGILSTASIVPRFVGAAKSVEGVSVLAVASRDLGKAREKAALWGIPLAFGSYDELLACPDIDTVYVAVINSAHYGLSRQALLHGKHVLCEKPFTLDPEQASGLFSLAREKGLFIMEMQKTVFLPAAKKLKEIISGGGLGRVAMADFSSSFDPGYNSWFFDPQKGGGPLYNNASYSLELMEYLLGCRPVSWTGLSVNCETGVETSFAMVVKMDDGLIMTNKTSMDAATVHSGYVYGSGGYAELPEYWKASKLILHKNGSAPQLFEYPCRYELMYELEHAVSCINQGLTQSPVMTEEVTVNAVKVLAGMRSCFD